MRVGKFLVICGVLLLLAGVVIPRAEAQVRHRLPALRANPGQREAAARPATPAAVQNRELVSAKVVQLSPMLQPAIGPSGSQGVASFFYNDVDTSLNSGSLIVTGLPTGNYYAWIVFFDPLTSRKNVYSELVAKFTIPEDSVRTETALMMGLPTVINISDARQIVVTNAVKTDAEVGRKPVSGAAGQWGGPANGQAVLAANIN